MRGEPLVRVEFDRPADAPALRDRLSAEGKRHQAFHNWLVDRGYVAPDRIDGIRRELLGTRLADLRGRVEPVGRAGDSILIYRLP